MKVFILIYNLYLYKNIKYIYNVDWRDKKPFQHLKIVKRQPRLVCLEQSEGEPSPASALCSLHLSPLTSHKMGNYSSSWTSPNSQDSAGELSDVSLAGEEESMEASLAREFTLTDFPSEVWACVIAFLPFREKVE